MLGSLVLVNTLLAVASIPSAYGSLLRRLEFQALMADPQCFIENGYDYVGNDIGNVLGAVTDCCGKCKAQNGCKAWSWTNYLGGTCWLKSGVTEIKVSKDVQSALQFDVAAPYCELLTDMDFEGNDLSNVPNSKVTDCCGLCQKTAGCRAYSWNDYNGGTCWLKSKAGKAVSKPGVTAAKAYPDKPATCPTLKSDVDYPGFDIANKPAIKPEDCCSICQTYPGCRAYSWSNLNGGTCWLKQLAGTPVAKPGVVSAQLIPNPIEAANCQLADNTDLVDNDIGRGLSPDPKFCCSLCKDFPKCAAFAWNSENGGTCWFKSAKGTSITVAGVKSGAI